MSQVIEKFEIVDNHENMPKILGTVSWNGSELEFKPNTLARKFYGIQIHVGGRILTFDDGLDFIKGIPHYYRSGYLALRRVE